MFPKQNYSDYDSDSGRRLTLTCNSECMWYNPDTICNSKAKIRPTKLFT